MMKTGAITVVMKDATPIVREVAGKVPGMLGIGSKEFPVYNASIYNDMYKKEERRVEQQWWFV